MDIKHLNSSYSKIINLLRWIQRWPSHLWLTTALLAATMRNNCASSARL